MPSILTKLPDNAVQKANLTVINEVSQKFYQVYIIEKANSRYDIVTAHGRIGHTAKFLLVAIKVSEGDTVINCGNIIANKKKKGYVENKLNVDPVSLLPKTVGIIKTKVALKKSKIKNPLLVMDTQVITDQVEPIKPKKDLKHHRIANLFG